MPPAACMADDAVITAMMMKNASTGGDPGGRWKMKTRTAVPTTPQRPRPIPPVRTPRTIAPEHHAGLKDDEQDLHSNSFELCRRVRERAVQLIRRLLPDSPGHKGGSACYSGSEVPITDFGHQQMPVAREAAMEQGIGRWLISNMRQSQRSTRSLAVVAALPRVITHAGSVSEGSADPGSTTSVTAERRNVWANRPVRENGRPVISVFYRVLAVYGGGCDGGTRTDDGARPVPCRCVACVSSGGKREGGCIGWCDVGRPR